MPKVEILIVSYSKDIPYLRYNLASIAKFARGFSGVTIICPEQERNQFLPFARPGTVVRTYNRSPESVKWHLQAQAQKCMADLYCPDADFILHTDSDCIFTAPVTPDDYFVDGKPVMVIEAYDHVPNRQWQPVVEAVLKCHVTYETMRRHPQVNPRQVYESLRRYIELRHGMRFEQYVLSLKPTFPWGFTEHNVIGAFALEAFPKAYHWIDLGKERAPKSKLVQFWSLSPPDRPQTSPNDGTPFIPVQFARKILNR